MQSAALPYRQNADGSTDVLLVTSRTRKRWVLPKGRVAPGMQPHHSAAREVMEEAGVIGLIDSGPIGDFTTAKQSADGMSHLIRVKVFPLAVTSELQRWPEDHQRRRQWLPLTRAIKVVEDPGIRMILQRFAATREHSARRQA